jgi:AraC-like DNA-binding protein
MRYGGRVFTPSPDLTPYVLRYYLFDEADPGAPQISTAWVKRLLTLRFGEPVRAGPPGELNAVGDMTLSGPVTRPFAVAPGGNRFRLFVVELTPIGVSTLFRENSEALVDESVDLCDVIPPRTRHALTDALAEVDDLARKVILVESFLRQFVPGRGLSKTARRCAAAASRISASGGLIRVSALCDELGVTTRHLQRSFSEITGLTPKRYGRIVRFNRAFRALAAARPAELSRVAIDSGFYDYAHFAHEVFAHTGYYPRELPLERFAMYRLALCAGE